MQLQNKHDRDDRWLKVLVKIKNKVKKYYKNKKKIKIKENE